MKKMKLSRWAGSTMAAILLLATGCNDRQFTIEGNVTGAAGDTLYLENNTLSPIAKVDSVVLDDKGAFRFRHTQQGKPAFYRLRLGSSVVNLLVDSTVTTLHYTGAKETFATQYDIEGNPDCVIMQQVAQQGSRLKEQFVRLMQAPDTARLTELHATLTRDLAQYKTEMARLVMQAPASPVAYFIIMQQINGLPIFDTYNVDDNRIIAAAATAHETYAPDEPRTAQLRNLALQGMAARRAQRNEAAGLSTDTLPQTGFMDITLYDLRGNERRLSDITKSHRVVVLDFTAYAYEYSPQYNIMLASLYDKYHSLGMEIYQVSFDIDEHHWKVSADNLPWVCVHDSESLYSPLISLYNIQSLPTCYIIVDNGDRLIRPDSDDSLARELAKIFGK